MSHCTFGRVLCLVCFCEFVSRAGNPAKTSLFWGSLKFTLFLENLKIFSLLSFLQIWGKKAVLSFICQEKVAFFMYPQLLAFQFRAYKSWVRMSGRLGGGPWKGIRINWSVFCHWLGQYVLPSGFPLNFKQISVKQGNALHMLLMPLSSTHKNAIFLER